MTCYEAIPSYQGAVCKIAKPGLPTVVLLGDSHANALFSGLASATAADPLTNVLNVGAPGHVPFVGIESGKADGGEQERKHHMVEFDRAVAFAEHAPSVRTVIIASRGPLYLSGYLPWNHSGPHDFVVSMPGRPDITSNGEIWRTGMRETLARLVVKGKQVIFVLDVPELDFNAKDCLEYRPLRFTERKLRSPCALRRTEFEARNREYRELVASVLKDFPMVKVFDAAVPICDSQWCWVIKEGKILYRDADHLSVEGSRLVGQQLARLLVREPAAVPLTTK